MNSSPASTKLRSDGRQDDVGGVEVVVLELLALGAHDLQQLLEGRVEASSSPDVDRPHGGVVELVEARVQAVVEAVLPLVGDPDDHEPWPSSICLDSPAPEPGPSSAFILASSSSTWVELESCASWRSMSSWPGAEGA